MSVGVEDRVVRRRDRADERARGMLIDLGREVRIARRSADLSQAAVAEFAGVHQSQVSRIERARLPRASLRMLSRVLDSVGLELSVRAYVGGDAIRDAGQVRTLARLRTRLADSWRWTLEEPLPMAGDRRAWDAVLRRGGVVIAIEVESRPSDLQALLRRLALKRRDGGVSRLVLVLPSTRSNRALLRAHEGELRLAFPVGSAAAIAALSRGVDPGGDAVVVI